MSVERRCFTRYAISFPLRLQTGLEKTSADFNVECLNFSLKGLEIDCNSELVRELQKQEQYPQLCMLDFSLPGEEYHFVLKAQVVTYRRLSLHHYRVGLVYSEMPERARQIMARYLRLYRLGDFEYRSLIQAGTRPDNYSLS